jgi:hypothetical protein
MSQGNDKEKVDRHLKQWKHNRAFARTIDTPYRDWQVNVIFYTALHLIDATLIKLGVAVTNHTERNEAVKTNQSLASVRTQYLDLYRISRITRYVADPDQWLPQEYLTISDLVDHLLKPIENNLGAILGNAVKFDPLPLKS